ncbi:AtpZ/AtpI family protein [Paraburkholderia sp. Ac-20342]|uniref:AtpZ/AtpI family protein n=1 Tax=Paraburkholderia sp. Ac-20342 TaxID=2703889 RepID=UPI00197DB80C|nr:AtpZ/AtpI family protein [Paraburkholderia sp. Ac-20342]MBN3848820.1 AtpZ/AtpI family protein [Paraburkholderia sp. Ac-20342]
MTRDDGQRLGKPAGNATGKPADSSGSSADPSGERVARAARQAMLREHEAHDEPEPSLGARLGQIGILGWTIVVPTLLSLLLGHWLDRYFSTGVFFSAPLVMIGAGIGWWFAWKWMHRQTRRH